LVQELVPAGEWQRQKISDAKKLGLVDWSPEMGGEPSLYKPDSFALLSAAAQERHAGAAQLAFDVTLRAIVMYKKNLSAKAGMVLHPDVRSEVGNFTHHDIELVMLEILRVNAVHKRGERYQPVTKKRR
jgi:hypothetical protein